MGTIESIQETLNVILAKVDNLERMLSEQLTKDVPEVFLNIKEAGELLRLSPQTVYALVHRREVPHNKKGNRLYFLKSELEQWMKEGRRKTIKEISA